MRDRRAATIALEISSRNARVAVLQNRWDRLRRVIDERATIADYAAVPRGTAGLLFRDLRRVAVLPGLLPKSSASLRLRRGADESKPL